MSLSIHCVSHSLGLRHCRLACRLGSLAFSACAIDFTKLTFRILSWSLFFLRSINAWLLFLRWGSWSRITIDNFSDSSLTDCYLSFIWLFSLLQSINKIHSNECECECKEEKRIVVSADSSYLLLIHCLTWHWLGDLVDLPIDWRSLLMNSVWQGLLAIDLLLCFLLGLLSSWLCLLCILSSLLLSSRGLILYLLNNWIAF